MLWQPIPVMIKQNFASTRKLLATSKTWYNDQKWRCENESKLLKVIAKNVFWNWLWNWLRPNCYFRNWYFISQSNHNELAWLLNSGVVFVEKQTKMFQQASNDVSGYVSGDSSRFSKNSELSSWSRSELKLIKQVITIYRSFTDQWQLLSTW